MNAAALDRYAVEQNDILVPPNTEILPHANPGHPYTRFYLNSTACFRNVLREQRPPLNAAILRNQTRSYVEGNRGGGRRQSLFGTVRIAEIESPIEIGCQPDSRRGHRLTQILAVFVIETCK